MLNTTTEFLEQIGSETDGKRRGRGTKGQLFASLYGKNALIFS